MNTIDAFVYYPYQTFQPILLKCDAFSHSMINGTLYMSISFVTSITIRIGGVCFFFVNSKFNHNIYEITQTTKLNHRW